MAVVAAGWGVTCKSFDNFGSFSCTGYQLDEYAPHGAEIIAAAVSHIQNISH